MSCPVSVRLACTADLPRVVSLERTVPEAPHWNEAVYSDYVAASSFALQRKALFVALQKGSLVGFIVARIVHSEAEIESIAVDASQRRCGVGSLLLSAMQTWMRREGARILLLEVRSANAQAQAFYRSRGFAPVGLRRAYYRDPPDDAVLMRLVPSGTEPHTTSPA